MCRRSARGVTLIEIMVTVVLIALLTGGFLAGSGAFASSRLRGATTMIAGAIRLAFTRASSTSQTMRLVLDIDNSRVWLEQSSDSVRVAKDANGGAAAATEEEKEAQETAARIVAGPRPPRPRFTPVKAFGFEEADDGKQGRALGTGVRIARVETPRLTEAQTSGRAYLYFWPGGRTERAAIYLKKKDNEDTKEGITILVSPLTGKVQTVGGMQSMERPRDDGTSSEREDHPF